MLAPMPNHRARIAAPSPPDAHRPRLPVLRPQLPRCESYLGYLREIDDKRCYSNFGPLVRRFEAQLARHFSVRPGQIASFANGTLALTLGLLALNAERGKRCLMPAWTFYASPAAALAAGLVPHFVDVAAESWALDPQALRRRDDLDGVGAVMVVAPFGAPIDRAAWDAFTAETGIPVLIDAAAAFDSIGSVAAAAPGTTPMMVSLHATKAFGIGEGAILLSSDEAFIATARRHSNFGIVEDDAAVAGINAKLNEFSAAVGLAALKQWPMRRLEAMAVTAAYRAALQRIPGIGLVPGYGEGWVSSYCCVTVAQGGKALAARLDALGIDTRRWWRDGCHNASAYRRLPRDPLPVTEDLVQRYIGLPFSPDLTPQEIERVAEALAICTGAEAVRR